MPSHKRSNKSYKKREDMKKGGAGAADYMIAVAGAPGAQQAVPVTAGNGSNLLAYNASAAASLKGGRRKRRGGTLGEIAVPALLLVANESGKKYVNRGNTYKNRRSRRNRSRKYRR